MKKTIIILAVLLSAMLFMLEVSKVYANTIKLNKLEFVTFDQEVVYARYFEPGTSLQDLVIPDGPEKDGYIFVGWSIEVPEFMPNSHIRIEAQYMQPIIVVHESIGTK